MKTATSVLVDTTEPGHRFRNTSRVASGFSCIPQLILRVCLLTAILGAGAARAGQPRALPGHVPPAAGLAQSLGSLPATNSLHLAISLPFRNAESLTNLLRQLYDPASPSFHHFLNPQQFSTAFGPTEQDYQAVIAFANANGLSISATSSNRALLEVRAPVSAVEKAFHVHLQTFRHPVESRSFYAPDVEPSVDSDIPMLFIAGLNDYLIPRPASLHFAPAVRSSNLIPNGGSQGGYYVGQDFRSAYVPGVTNTGTGQSVALVEFDSYYPADVADYLALQSAGLSGSTVNLSNVVLGLTGNPGSGNVEVALDIDMAISMAPGLSTIYVYEGTNDAAAADIILNRILSDDLARQISCSWSGFNDATVRSDLLQFGMQGQSFFQASGDSGAYTSTFFPNKNPVPQPCDNPNITVVGGTTLNTIGPNGSWVSETTWSWFTQPLGSLSNSATSGGISPSWSIPSWQQGISMSANSGSTSRRNLPDVAMVANNIFLYGDDGSPLTGGGTSASAPLWAGLAALINQQRAAQAQPKLGFMNPTLYAIGKGANYNSCFHDITVGNNTNFSSTSRFSAVAGYDLCTGWGTPNGANLLAALAPEPLQITPSAGFVSTGPYGGPFSVTSQSYTLTNVATSSFNWTLAITSPWLSASVSSGALVSGGAAATVSISLNSAASNLTVGVYTNTIWFTNLNDTVPQSRQFVLTVSKRSLTVTAANAARAYGQPNPLFQGTIIGLQNGDNITATYSCSAGTGSGVGNYPIVPSLNDPASLETNYSFSLVDGTLTVNQAAVVITWASPVPINYGTALGPTQLDAKANVPGTFAYDPDFGAVLPAGTNALSVSFTAADNLDYSSATDTVNLVVNSTVTGDIAGEPLLPIWGFPAMLAGLLILGFRFLVRPAESPNKNGKS